MTARRLCGALIAVAVAAVPSAAWWGNGHYTLTAAAVRALAGSSLPSFFVNGAAQIAHCSVDPDLVRGKATPHAGGATSPDHFLDLELLQGRTLPDDRWAYQRLCADLGVDARKAGFLPYAVMEQTERLAVAFAECRKWPDDSLVQAKCLVYAGNLAHFAEDLCQPLHLTIHYNGRAGPDGTSPRSGIHDRVDGLVENLSMRPDSLAAGQTPGDLRPLADHVFGQLRAQNRLVDSTYALRALVDGKDFLTDPAVRRFAHRQAREATRFTASIFLTAWELSRTVELESWLDRRTEERGQKSEVRGQKPATRRP